MNNTISPEALNALISAKKNILIVDCRFALNDPEAGFQAYIAGHIPNAHYLHLDHDLSSAPAQHGGRHPLPDPQKLEKTLQTMGADQTTWIICYDAHKGAYACRAWWLLRYFGHTKVSVLNGGWQAWLARYPEQVETQQQRATPLKNSATNPAPLELKPGHAPVAHIDALLNPKRENILIDSREKPRFDGVTEPIDPIAGHIPAAINLPWQSATDSEGFFLSPDDSAKRLEQITNQINDQINDPKNITVYCGSGVTACVNIFALAELGIEATLYPGSWSDWCSYVTEENFSARVATMDDAN